MSAVIVREMRHPGCIKDVFDFAVGIKAARNDVVDDEVRIGPRTLGGLLDLLHRLIKPESQRSEHCQQQ